MSNYLYNDVELPELPEWDKTTHPYAYIFRVKPWSRWLYCLHCTSSPFYGTSSSGDYCIGRRAGDVEYDCYEGDYLWGEQKTSANDGVLASLNDNLIWSNFDILNEDGSIYLPATDPVPVGGEPTLTARDLYKIINGKPTKLTLYKKLGGKLIPLDEHTKEVKT